MKTISDLQQKKLEFVFIGLSRFSQIKYLVNHHTYWTWLPSGKVYFSIGKT